MNKYEKLSKYYEKKYGITWKQRMSMWRAQGGKCDICKRHEREFKNRLAVDHSHEKGKNGMVRGLLCYTCNRHRVGRLNLYWAKAVYEYLLKYDSPEES